MRENPGRMVTPVRRVDRPPYIYEGGVFDADGSPVSASLLSRGGVLIQDAKVASSSGANSVVQGKWLYGGILLLHYGHFITESLARLYAWNDSEFKGVVFQCADNVSTYSDLPAWASDALSMFGVGPEEFLVVKDCTYFESISVDPAGIELNGFYNNIHADYLASVISRNLGPGKGYEKVYVSRSLFSKGVVACESLLERTFKENGYHIIHPEKCSFREQLRSLKGAKVVVGLSGSALHTLMFLDQVPSALVEIQRRGIANGTQNIINRTKNIKSFIISGIIEESRNDSRAAILLDINKIISELKELGFIEKTSVYDFEAVESEYRLLSEFEELRHTLNLTPQPRLSEVVDDNTITLLKEMISVRPDLSSPVFLLGRVKLSNKEYREASLWFQKCVEMAPGVAEYSRLLSESYYRLGDCLEALRCIDEVISLKLGSTEPLFFKALILSKMGDLERAVHCLEACLTFSPAYAPAINLLSSLGVKKTLHIHIGMHKTATTTVQNALVRNNQQLKRVGCALVTSDKVSNINRYHHELAWSLIGDPRCTISEQSWNDVVSYVHNSNFLDFIISSEDFCLASNEQVERLFGYLGDAGFNVKIHVVARNPIENMASRYFARLDVSPSSFSGFSSQLVSQKLKLFPSFCMRSWGTRFGTPSLSFYEEMKVNIFPDFMNVISKNSLFPRDLMAECFKISSKNISRGTGFQRFARDVVRGIDAYHEMVPNAQRYLLKTRSLRTLHEVFLRSSKSPDIFSTKSQLSITEEVLGVCREEAVRLKLLFNIDPPMSFTSLPSGVVVSEALVDDLDRVKFSSEDFVCIVVGLLEYIHKIEDLSIRSEGGAQAKERLKKSLNDALKVSESLKATGHSEMSSQLSGLITALINE